MRRSQNSWYIAQIDSGSQCKTEIQEDCPHYISLSTTCLPVKHSFWNFTLFRTLHTKHQKCFCCCLHRYNLNFSGGSLKHPNQWIWDHIWDQILFIPNSTFKIEFYLQGHVFSIWFNFFLLDFLSTYYYCSNLKTFLKIFWKVCHDQ